jgi:hypothetical protein
VPGVGAVSQVGCRHREPVLGRVDLNGVIGPAAASALSSSTACSAVNELSVALTT